MENASLKLEHLNCRDLRKQMLTSTLAIQRFVRGLGVVTPLVFETRIDMAMGNQPSEKWMDEISTAKLVTGHSHWM